jgi:hypothetical protein
MSRPVFPFAVGDISAFARSLSAQLVSRDAKPGHLELLNVLARCAGFRNYQHFRAAHAAHDRLESRPVAQRPIDHAKVEQAVRHFDSQARLMRWPAKPSHQQLCLWVLWSNLASRETFTETQINKALQVNHLFGDHALLRRELFDGGFVTRTVDGREYRRVEREPPPEALSLIRHLRLRQAA